MVWEMNIPKQIKACWSGLLSIGHVACMDKKRSA
jgi:hypothetical protein